jgi:hypothetical protein
MGLNHQRAKALCPRLPPVSKPKTSSEHTRLQHLLD